MDGGVREQSLRARAVVEWGGEGVLNQGITHCISEGEAPNQGGWTVSKGG